MQKIIKDIQSISKDELQFSQEKIKQIKKDLDLILDQCGPTLEIYQEPVNQISQLVRNCLKDIQDMSSNKNDINYKMQHPLEIINQINLFEELKPLYNHCDEDLQNELQKIKVQKYINDFSKRLNNQTEQQIEKLQNKLDFFNYKFNDKNIGMENSQLEKYQNFTIDTDSMISWYKSVLIQYYYYEYYQDLKIQETAKIILSLNDLIQKLYDNIDILFINNTGMSFKIIEELKYLDNFICYVKQENLKKYNNKKYSQQQIIEDDKIIFYQNLENFEKFCSNQPNSQQKIIHFNNKIDNIYSEFWQNLDKLQIQEFKKNIKIIYNLKQVQNSNLFLQDKIQNIQKNLSEKFQQYQLIIIDGLDKWEFQDKDIQQSYFIIENTEKLLLKYQFLDKSYLQNIQDQFKGFINRFKDAFELMFNQVNDINKNLQQKGISKEEEKKLNYLLQKIVNILKNLQYVSIEFPALKQQAIGLINIIFDNIKHNAYNLLKDIKIILLTNENDSFQNIDSDDDHIYQEISLKNGNI
ncbi:hypothetical protein PPERSA_06036 [Pseudocohnilembus persalinus]|uniref:Uncharacterized protein n=1 Tax=Pseudocohnilembus persalinus TaxID=266149 RepID=A0A0V0QQ43_PSEPJ|nr:hypothetical protein PPERSA_06036 [Pseudocohnilembus persalinus]|eukprot:KRX04483.1 hypothetical protein PPERSA_06036 [Pseudocohnilembus persalinus]